MPGICGIVHLSNDSSDSSSTVSNMASRISFGRSTPNEVVRAGNAVFGSSSISGTVDHIEAAKSRDGKLICVVDGYIFPESIGSEFSVSDTAKVLLESYIENDATVFDRLRGQFSLALWDGRDHTLYLVTDILATRNVYYIVKDDTLIFSSHMYGFSAVPGFSYNLDSDGLLQYMTLGFCAQDYTLFSNITIINSARCFTWRGGEIAEKQYWTPKIAIGSESNGNKPEDALYDVFYSSVSRMKRFGDIHGIGLSGGKDSRVMAGLLSRVNGVTCYGKTYNINPDELGIATEIARELDFKHEIVYYDESHYEKMMSQCALMTEGGINTGEFCLLTMQNVERHDVLHWGWLADTLSGRGLHHQSYLSARNRDDMYELLFKQNIGGFISLGDLTRAMTMTGGRDPEENIRAVFDSMMSEISVDELHQYVVLMTINQRHRRRSVRVMNVSSHFSPTLFPFAQEEIINFLLTQPLKHLMAQRLYLKMIVKHFPELAKYRHPQYPFSFRQEYHLSPYIYSMLKVKRFINKFKPEKAPAGSIDSMYSNYIRKNMNVIKPLVMNLSDGRGILNSDYVLKTLNEHAEGIKDSCNLILKLMTLEQFLQYTIDSKTLENNTLSSVLAE